MMSAEQIIAFWGHDNLKRWHEETLRAVALPNLSKRFLIEVGLPCKEDWTLRFDPKDNHLPTQSANGSYYCIGFDDFVPICLDTMKDGCVVAIEAEVDGMVRFINSSLECFGEFLVLYQEYRKTARVVSDEEIVNVISGIEDRMRKTDPKAFGDSNNYWPVVIEQMTHGLL